MMRAEPSQRANDVRGVVGVDVEDAMRIVAVRARRRVPPLPFVLLGQQPDEDDRPVDFVDQAGDRLRDERRDEDVSFVVGEPGRAVAADAREAVGARPQTFPQEGAAGAEGVTGCCYFGGYSSMASKALRLDADSRRRAPSTRGGLRRPENKSRVPRGRGRQGAGTRRSRKSTQGNAHARHTESRVDLSAGAEGTDLSRGAGCFRATPRSASTEKSISSRPCRAFAHARASTTGSPGHLTVRDPEHPDLYWTNPMGVHFAQVTVSNLDARRPRGNVVEGKYAINRAGFVLHAAVHAAHPGHRRDVPRAHVYGTALRDRPPARHDLARTRRASTRTTS